MKTTYQKSKDRGVLRSHSGKELQNAPTSRLILWGISMFLWSLFVGWVLKEPLVLWIKQKNVIGFVRNDLLFVPLISFWAMALWVFSCMAARCHQVLFERLFK